MKALLAAKEIDVNKPNDDEWTPLHIAAKWGYTEIVKIFLAAKGIEVNEPNDDGWPPLYIAAKYGRVGAVIILLEDEIHVYPDVRREIVNRLLNPERDDSDALDPADLNTTLEDGRTLLSVASKKGYIELVRALLANGADVNKGKNPLLAALENGQVRVMDILLGARGIDKTQVIPKVLPASRGLPIFEALRAREMGKKNPYKMYTINNTNKIQD